MQQKNLDSIFSFISALILISLACGVTQPTSTSTPEPTATSTAIPTNTPRPSPTPRPTQTPDLAATQRAEDLNAEAQAYFDKGYLTTNDGSFTVLEDFSYDWAQLGWYNWLPLGESASDFFLSGHFKWDSAFKNSDISGCGFIFALQENNDHYAVFLDRSKVFFLITDQALGYSRPIATTRGTGRVKFDYPAEADFTLIVKGNFAYVLVDGEVVGEYTLAQSRPMQGNLGLTVLSGTNRDYGTHCEMTDLHLWLPSESPNAVGE
jgi:hypothetical protein